MKKNCQQLPTFTCAFLLYRSFWQMLRSIPCLHAMVFVPTTVPGIVPMNCFDFFTKLSTTVTGNNSKSSTTSRETCSPLLPGFMRKLFTYIPKHLKTHHSNLTVTTITIYSLYAMHTTKHSEIYAVEDTICSSARRF